MGDYILAESVEVKAGEVGDNGQEGDRGGGGGGGGVCPGEARVRSRVPLVLRCTQQAHQVRRKTLWSFLQVNKQK